MTSNNNGEFYCLGCLHWFQTDNALKKHEGLCNNYDYCHVEMPANDNKTLKYHHGEKWLKAPFAIYVDFECLPIKQQSCQNNPNDSYTERKAIHESCGYSLDLYSSFDSKQNKHSFYKGRDCTKKFSKDLNEQATKITNFKKKEMIPQQIVILSFMKRKKYVIYVKKSFILIKMIKINLNYIRKLEIIVIIQENLEERLIAFVI